MEPQGLLRDEFVTLRDEIRATKARLFWIVVLGLFGVPLLAYLASQAHLFVWLLLPFSVLALILMFLAEQSSMMRAGRYIREKIETDAECSAGWEQWVESLPQFRFMDKQYVACFVIIFFAYYFLTIGVAVNMILSKQATDTTSGGFYSYWLYGAVVIYAIGAIWALWTLQHHWKATVSTTAEEG
ncbi:MAG: hypothetical protein GY778_08180 [bacterium]|nr:hypothetical protein [bacterium]